ncbi:hypothetical protein [Salipiger abyssi]|uniref:Uncharacterized protein n=1 Tax=Salipiger abyssi TaxID=1250539 RepID=A0A1P8UWF9_9RHOB|nr:hypothetical protein [Salipiger abyssi]APZ53721.1 hypothetical protein Ga0080574_TMP3387 [Salipiger abyssi]
MAAQAHIHLGQVVPRKAGEDRPARASLGASDHPEKSGRGNIPAALSGFENTALTRGLKTQDEARRVKNPAQNSNDVSASYVTSPHRAAARRWFSRLLWRAFPAESERDLARHAAPVLGVSERQVINWLRQEHDAGVSYVTAVMILAGLDVLFERGA